VRTGQVRDSRQDGRCETSSGCRSGRTRTPVVTVEVVRKSDVLRAVVNSESAVQCGAALQEEMLQPRDKQTSGFDVVVGDGDGEVAQTH
jgi:hypothetical protein